MRHNSRLRVRSASQVKSYQVGKRHVLYSEEATALAFFAGHLIRSLGGLLPHKTIAKIAIADNIATVDDINIVDDISLWMASIS